MADKKSGPVKPPIIDAKARSAGGSDDTTTPKTTPDASTSGAVKPDASSSSAPTASASAAPKPSESAAKTGATQSAAAAQSASKPGATGTDPAKDTAPKSATKPAEAEAPKSDAAKSGTAKTDTTKPEAGKSTGPSGTGTVPPSRSAKPTIPLAPLAATAGAGALIGLALAYGLASVGFWPGTDDAGSSALAELEARTAAIEENIDQQQTQAASRIDTLEADLASRLDEISNAAPSTEGLAAQSDLDALSSQIEDISTRLEALAAGASGDESSQIASQINSLSGDLTALTERLGAIEPQVADIAPAVEDAQTRLDDLDARIVDQPAFDAVSAERDRFARLPAALDALEDAINSGAPFASQLAETEILLPNLSVAEETRALAASGVSSPDQLLADFRNAIPAILAARPQNPEANWAQSLLDQAASAIALRPTQGDGPQAIVGRIETALEAGDLTAAQEGFTALPDAMQSAASGFEADLDDAVAASTLLAEARATNPASSQTEAAQ